MKLALITLILVLAGCPRHTRKTLTPDVPQHGDATARNRFLEAKSRFLRDGGQSLEFKKIIQEYPADPIVPWAELYAGIASVKARSFAEADAQLTSLIERNVDPGLTARAQLFLGITKNYEGDAATARKLLATSERAIENDDERTEYLAAVAYSTAVGDKPLAALPVFDLLWQRVTPTEKALIVARCQELVSALDRNTLERLFDEIADRRGPAIGAVGSRLVVIYDRAADTQRADKMRENMVPVRQALGLPRTITEAEVGSAQSGGGDAGLIGAVVPLGSKKENRVAEQAVAGLGLAAGAPDGKGVVAIETRAAIDKTTSAEAVDALAQKNVIAIIGPIGKDSVDGASARAENLGVPMISLSTSAEQRPTGRFIFHIRHSPEHRARTLAQRALAKGIKTFAIMAPETPYGKGISAAFAEAVKQGGGTVVITVTYPDTAKSFTKEASSLKSGWDGIFIADEATRLGLIVPTLAAAGYVAKAQPWPKKMKNGRPILLLSTAEGLDASYLAAAGRHSEGALFAPGFFPDAADATQKPFIDRFVAAYSRQPEATEAYAFDAAQIAAAAGAGGRAGLATALAKSQLQGVTGAIQFNPDHRRSDPGVVYTVVEETGGVFAVRVAK
ncbi:MAG TPA: penicillin-binding protein activator [Kofleriaceae bacterium]|nr:penicillin-binding protein activator [Kofleriaceae bacterium]